MKFKLLMASALFVFVPNIWAASCGGFTMTANPGSTGSIDCVAQNKGKINFKGNDVESIDDHNTAVLYHNVTKLDAWDTSHGGKGASDTDLIQGLYNGNQKGFIIADSVWEKWNTIYIALKQGGGYALFLLSNLSGGKWSTPSGKNGSGLNQFLAFGGDPVPPTPTPVPAAFWLFGSALASLLSSRRKASV